MILRNHRKLFQIIIVWVLPLVGAVDIFIIVKYLTRKITYKIKRDFGGGVQDRGFSE
jgi:hypothetical protein